MVLSITFTEMCPFAFANEVSHAIKK